MPRKHDEADTIGETVYDYISGDHGFAKGPDDLAAVIRPLLKEALARRDAIIRTWMPIVRNHIEHHTADPGAIDKGCPECKLTRALAPEFSPERVAEEIK